MDSGALPLTLVPPPLISIVIPTYNEQKNIVSLLDHLHEVLSSVVHELIVVDDHSPDGTAAAVHAYQKTHSWVTLCVRDHDRGLGSAILKGFSLAHGTFLGVLDADHSHDPGVLIELLRRLEQGADLAIGSRRVPGGGADHWPWHRRWMSHWATFFSRRVLRLHVADPMSGYFVLRRTLYLSCRERLFPRGYKILIEILCKGKPARVDEVPFIFRDRRQGQSKLSLGTIRDFFLSVLILKGDAWAQRVRLAYHTGRYRKVAEWLQPGEVLDIGCGRPCETMPDQSFLRFLGRGTGIDLEPCEGPFPFVQASVTQIPFESHSFQNVTAMEVLEHVEEADLALSEISRVLARDGTLVVSFPNETPVWELIWHTWERTFGFHWKGTHVHTLSLDHWMRLLRGKFTIQAIRRHWYFDTLICLRPKP